MVEGQRPPWPEYIGDDKWRIWGQTADGRYLQVIHLFDPPGVVDVVHARDLNCQGETTMPKAKQKPYSSMNTAELGKATRQFDDPAYHPPALPWGGKQKREQRLANQLGRAMKVGRPKIGLGAERIQIAWNVTSAARSMRLRKSTG